MNCPHCQHENDATARFCEECGGALGARTCANCDLELKPAAKFCPSCGTPAGPASDATPVREPRAYTPKHLADKILQSKSALEGERKQVTVLFADVQGSMDLAEELDPEEWHQILDRFFQILTKGVHRFEGTVNQYTGDGIMALFGAPIAHEDHAQRACYAALHLRDEIARYATSLRREHGVRFAARMGLHSGEVIVGKIGDDLRMDYTAQGHTVGLAQRMEALAEDGKPYLTEATAKLVDGFFELDDQGELNIKGASTPVRVFALLRPGAARSRVDLASRKGLSHFVGRDEELASLVSTFKEADAGRGQVVGLVAGPGVGKSRLLKEFANHVRAAGAVVAESHCASHGRNVPLLSYLQARRELFGLEDRDDPVTVRRKITARFDEMYPELREYIPLWCDLFGAPDTDHPAPPMSPEERHRLLIEWEKRSHGAIAQTRDSCVVVLVEDLHWLDAASEAIIESIVAITPSYRHMFLCTYRPEYSPPWVSKSFYRQVPLPTLTEAAAGSLIGTLLGSELADSELARLLQDRCGGTPFFVEEMIQSLAESRYLEGERGAYRLTRAVRDIPLPSTVQSVLAARIDRLDEREKHVLQTASVIGRVFSRDILTAVTHDAAIDDALSTLVDAELVHEECVYPEVEYAFKHALIQDVAYASQLKGRRTDLHVRVAAALEHHYAQQLDEKAALLAQHWEAAGEALAAARWHRRAAEWVGRTDLSAATRHWESVRRLRRQAPDDREAAALGVAACRHLLQNMSFRVAVNLDDARALLDEGQALASKIEDRRAFLYLSMIYSRVLGGDGDVAANLELAVENQRAALEIDDVVVQANAATFLVDALNVSGALPELLRVAESEITRIPRHTPREGWLWGSNHHTFIRSVRAFGLIWVGRLPEALDELREVLRLTEEDRTPEIAGYAFFYTAEASYQAGDTNRTLANARWIQTVSDARPKHLGLRAHTPFAFGFAHLAAGRTPEAVVAFRTALDHHRRVDKAYAGKAASYLAEALLQTGDPAPAQAAAEEAIALCRRSLRAVYEAAAHGVLARALLRSDGASARTDAEAALANAAALIERTGAHTLAPALCEWRAELAATLGDEATQRQLLHEAQDGYTAIGAPGHAARLATALAS